MQKVIILYHCSKSITTWSLYGGGQSMPCTGCFTPRKDDTVQVDGWTPRPVWTDAQKLVPTRIRSPNCPVHCKPPHQLRYPSTTQPTIQNKYPCWISEMNKHVTVKKKSLNIRIKPLLCKHFYGWVQLIHSLTFLYLCSGVELQNGYMTAIQIQFQSVLYMGKTCRNQQRPKQMLNFMWPWTDYKWGINEVAIKGRKEIQVHSTSNTTVRKKKLRQTLCTCSLYFLPVLG